MTKIRDLLLAGTMIPALIAATPGVAATVGTAAPWLMAQATAPGEDPHKHPGAPGGGAPAPHAPAAAPAERRPEPAPAAHPAQAPAPAERRPEPAPAARPAPAPAPAEKRPEPAEKRPEPAPAARPAPAPAPAMKAPERAPAAEPRSTPAPAPKAVTAPQPAPHVAAPAADPAPRPVPQAAKPVVPHAAAPAAEPDGVRPAAPVQRNVAPPAAEVTPATRPGAAPATAPGQPAATTPPVRQVAPAQAPRPDQVPAAGAAPQRVRPLNELLAPNGSAAPGQVVRPATTPLTPAAPAGSPARPLGQPLPTPAGAPGQPTPAGAAVPGTPVRRQAVPGTPGQQPGAPGTAPAPTAQTPAPNAAAPNAAAPNAAAPAAAPQQARPGAPGQPTPPAAANAPAAPGAASQQPRPATQLPPTAPIGNAANPPPGTTGQVGRQGIVIPAPAAAPGQPQRQGNNAGVAIAAGAAAGFVGGFLASQAITNYGQVQEQRQRYDDDGAVIYREPGRTIIQDPDNRYFIAHDENERFRDLGYDVRSEREGDEYLAVYNSPDGSRITTYTDDNGRMLRRVRRFPDGRTIVLIDNGPPGPVRPIDDDIVLLPPPPLVIPRDRYIVEANQADEGIIYDTLSAPPVAPITRRYTLNQIRYSPDLRAHMRSVDVDTITFDTASFTVAPGQANRLAVIAQAINRAIQRNPQEIFLVEGYTDAVGSPVDNLSLSDRRAQSVATLLTQQFQVPPENLTTQGYGSQYLKIQTPNAEAANRRVTVRRITPLLQGKAQGAPAQAAPQQQ